MESKFTKEEKYLRAKKRLNELKGYYWHLGTYIVVNLFITVAQIVEGVDEGKSFSIIFSDFGVYGVWLIWGISLFFHTLKVFGTNLFFSENWEEKKLRKLIDKERY